MRNNKLMPHNEYKKLQEDNKKRQIAKMKRTNYNDTKHRTYQYIIAIIIIFAVIMGSGFIYKNSKANLTTSQIRPIMRHGMMYYVVTCYYKGYMKDLGIDITPEEKESNKLDTAACPANSELADKIAVK